MRQHIKTQISGKFSKEDVGVFQLKKKLECIGITVEFPFGNKIVLTHKGVPVTFKPTKRRSFYDVELAFFAAIRTNPIHVLHNKHGGRHGYIGESASIETVYAFLHAKPIVMLYSPVFSERVPECIQKLLRLNEGRFFIARIDTFPDKKLSAFMAKAAGNVPVRYDLCDTETEIGAMNTIARLFESYKAM